MNLQGHRNDAIESRPGYLKLYDWCVWIVQECDFHVSIIWISVLVGLFRVFANRVAYQLL